MLVFSADARRDYVGWQREDPKLLKRIIALITEALRDLSKGISRNR